MSLMILPASMIPEMCDYNEGTYTIKKKLESLNIHPVWVNDFFLDKFESQERYQIYMGGSGSSKSYFVAQKLIMMCRTNPFFRCLLLKHQASTVRTSQYQLIKDIVSANNLDDEFKFYESTLTIEHKRTKNKFLSFGLDDVEKLKSAADVTDIWFEEPITKTQKLSFQDFNELDRRLRSPKAKNHIFLTFNPVDKNNFVYEHFVKNPIFNKDQYFIHQSNYTHNFFCPEEEKIKYDRLKTVDYNEYRIYALGEWGNPRTGNEYIYQFKRDLHTRVFDVSSEKSRTIIAGYDFNVNPYIASLCAQVVNIDGVYEIRVFSSTKSYKPKNSIRELVKKQANDIFKKYKLYVQYTCDATGANKIPGFGHDKKASIQSALDELKDCLRKYSFEGGYLKFAKNPSKTLAQAAINNMFAGLGPKGEDGGLFRIVIHKDLEDLISELEDLQCGEDGFDPEKKRVDNILCETKGHLYSCLVYICYAIAKHYFKKSKNVQFYNPQSSV